jgi:hypothetical protein
VSGVLAHFSDVISQIIQYSEARPQISDLPIHWGPPGARSGRIASTRDAVGSYFISAVIPSSSSVRTRRRRGDRSRCHSIRSAPVVHGCPYELLAPLCHVLIDDSGDQFTLYIVDGELHMLGMRKIEKESDLLTVQTISSVLSTSGLSNRGYWNYFILPGSTCIST